MDAEAEVTQREAPPAGAGAPDVLATTGALRIIIETALAAVITLDEEGTVTGWSGRAAEMFGWSRDEMLGACLAEHIIPVAFRERHTEGLRHYRETGEGPVLGQVLELSALRRDGTEFPVELRISPAAELDGRTWFIAFITDISSRRRAAAELAASMEEARRANEAVTALVHMIVHELRSPVTVVSGFSDLLLEGAFGTLTDAMRRPVESVADKARQLQMLVDELLDVARMDAGAVAVSLMPVDACTATHEAAARVADRVRLAGASLDVAVPACPVMVEADSALLGRVLDNLLANAVNYGGSPAEIQLTLTIDDVARLAVADRGPGIPADQRDRVFHRFVRGDDATSPGTGLGLYLSRELVTRQHGTLELEDRPGGGSCFVLTLPLATEG